MYSAIAPISSSAPVKASGYNGTAPAFPVAANGTLVNGGVASNGTNGTTPALNGSTTANGYEKRYIQTAPDTLPTMLSRKARRAVMSELL